MVQKKGATIAHAVLLYAVTNDSFHIKNSYWDEPEIIIPIDRMTIYQSILCDKIPSEPSFGVSRVQIKKRFYNVVQDKSNWNPKPDDWMINDEGYFLSMRLK